MKLTLGFSPCPNDTFIFDALVNNKIDSGDFEFDIMPEDVQTLNEWALQGRLDISKISYGVLPLVLNDYIVLNSGGALGKGVGPLLIMPPNRLKGELQQEEILRFINNATIAIPGENTTAHMLFSLAFPGAKNKVFKVFNEIEDWLLKNSSPVGRGWEGAAGVIIHENRFTYRQKGLVKLMDLGEYWEQATGVPIPLGGIVAKRSLSNDVVKKIDTLIKKSVEYAFEHHYTQLTDYVKIHSQEMSEEVMRQHIDLYVNNFSVDLGADGKKAVMKLLEVYQQLHPETVFEKENIFITPE